MQENMSDKQLQIIEERLMTRANMIDVANKYRVFDNQEDMDPNEVFEAMKLCDELGFIGIARHDGAGGHQAEHRLTGCGCPVVSDLSHVYCFR